MTQGRPSAWPTTGLAGPVAVFMGVLLLLASPLMRGGNRHVALIPLEMIGLALLLALITGLASQPQDDAHEARPPGLLWLLLLSPVLLACIQLVPVPMALWQLAPGHGIYTQTLQLVGATGATWRPLSISPDATAASLLAGIPVAAALLLGFLVPLSRLRLLLRVVVALAFAQVMLGLLQVSGGQHSPLFVGIMTYGPPVGTFSNRNHFANYIAMALAAYVWLAYESTRDAGARRERSSFGRSQRAAAWIAGGLVLVVGILMSRSRGAALFGLPMALAGLGVVALRIGGRERGLRIAVPIALLVLFAGAALIGLDALTSRVSGDQLASSASFRGTLARSSLQGAIAFWPFGAGWGTYDLAYQRFQPMTVAGYANHAHQDYIEMLLEGGVVALVLATAFAWLVLRRARLLARLAWRDRKLRRDAMAAGLCGLGLLGFLLHSLVEFNMRIPANAILAALLAGVYLRPLQRQRRSHDRPSQPYPAGH